MTISRHFVKTMWKHICSLIPIGIWIGLGLCCVSVSSVSDFPSPGLGFSRLNCPSRPNGNVFSPCHKDCQDNHNAKYGFCGNISENDFSCYCTRPKATINPISRQCVDLKHRQQYDDICRTDCLCDHGGVDYFCNYETHACECKGQNLDMKLCPFTNLEDLVLSVVRHKLPGYPTPAEALQRLRSIQ